ncbi:MAG: prephenate dehydratase [Nitrospirae bacterium]|nr:prephenate dehydratase [Nitrospirota bacterium]
MDEMDDLRREIDGIDSEILKLLNRRANLAIRVGKIKADRKTDIHAPHREREVYDRMEKENQGPLPPEAVRTIFREIMSAALALEHPLRVAYLGPKATFTHLACLKQFGLSANFIPAASIKEVFGEVERGRVDYGVVPIENSTEGVVNHTLDMFVDSPLKINAEVLQEVSHHLLSVSGRMEDVKRIYSHPHAIAQCSHWLESHLPHVPVVEASSTARAAEMSEEDPTAAAIASELASKLYGLKIIKARIEDHAHNFTRFLVIGRGQVKKTGKDKTSIMFSVKDRVGALYQILQPLADLEINLTKIESRPSRKKVWEYLFFVDLEGHVEEEKIQKALSRLEEGCQFLKVLGSYPVAVG